MTANNICARVDRSLARLGSAHPVIAGVLLSQEIQYSDADGATAATNGETLIIGSTWTDQLSDPQIDHVLAHEALHVLAEHHRRRMGRCPDRWNAAADYAINGLLKKYDIGDCIDGGLYSEKFERLSEEEIYSKLIDDSGTQKDGKPEDGTGKGESLSPEWGRVEDDPNEPNETGEPADMDTTAAAISAAELLSAGDANAGAMLGDIQAIRRGRVDWRVIMRRWGSRTIGASMRSSEQSWTRPGRRAAGKFRLPGRLKADPGRVVIAIDTSGSTIGRDLLAAFLGELERIREYHRGPVDVICVDVGICSEKRFRPGEAIRASDIEIRGGGGTSYQSIDRYAARKKDTTAVIYLTDGCVYFPRRPEYRGPVLVVVPCRTTYMENLARNFTAVETGIG